MVWIQEQSWLDDWLIASLLRRGVLLSTCGIVSKAKVQLPLGDSVRVEVSRQSRYVPHVGVIDQGLEGDGAPVEEVEDLRSPSCPRYGGGMRQHWDQITGSFQHLEN